MNEVNTVYTDDALEAKEMIERWLSDGHSWVGIFENRDMSHPQMGRRIAMSFDDSQWDAAEIGKTRSPDHKSIGLGWRYLLVRKTTDANLAMAYLNDDENPPETWEECGCCGCYHPPGFVGDCREDENRWP